ncbi:ABC transporter substrate-binding protein [Xanthobacter agilis]|uniref:NitT/TauT family transport system substrate-binding protein n=1 Tax=Xanthobacter agilis TaxID=47492 RepID=A0ABU0LCM7_XANAG|nr:ABC transporter substrate-binding protein [Xanthobacter agilis]MDQ0504888.1 NitT/TauT family transport system substrate-binding protein [Xanthobacter agilis]
MSGLLSRRQMLSAFAASGLAAMGAGGLSRAFAKPAEGLEILGAPNGSTIVLVRLLASGGLNAAAPGSTFRLWRDTDDLRAAIVSDRTRLFTTPTHVPANLANRGLPLKLFCILSMGHLTVVSADDSIKDLKDLAGKDVLGFFRNDMPDLVFRACLKGAGMDPDKDVKLTYVQTPMEAAQMLVAGRVTTAVLSEPPATAAIMMAKQAGKSLYRAVNLQTVWRDQHNGLGLPMAGIAVHEKLIEDNPEVIAALRTGLVPAKDWVLANTAAAGELAQEKMGMKAPIFAASLDHFNVVATGAKALKPGLVAFYETILSMQPDALGGKLPPDDFYLDM